MPGVGVRRGGDDTLFATTTGTVVFERRKKVRFDGRRVIRRFVHVR